MKGLSLKVLVLSAQRYLMEDTQDKEKIISGCKIKYVENLQGSTQLDSKGVSVLEGNLPYNEFENLGELPGWVEMVFELNAVQNKGKTKAELKPVSAKYIAPYSEK